MKLSWGTGIWAFYGLFVLMILAMVGISVVQKIDLVTDNYYEEEVKFQGKIDKINRAKELATPLTWEVLENGVRIHYPTNMKGVSGKINFYCPADNRKDFSTPIQVGADGTQFISNRKIKAGRYQLQIDWQANGIGYWNEGILNI